MPPCLPAAVLAGVPHGFFGRHAADDGSAAGLGRYREAVRDRLCPGGALVMLRQTHSADCVVVDQPWEYDARPEGDALVTVRPGTIVAIVTADCAPVLLADPEAGVVGAAHAGWRGALGGVLENTVAAMERLGAARGRIAAAIGPTIAQASYEVDEEFRRRFGHEAERFFVRGREGRWQFDLPGYAAHRLRAAGVAEVENLGRDTYIEEAHFHSFRRATHRGVAGAGRQISAVALC